MALKPDRKVFAENIRWKSEAAVTAGAALTTGTQPSGAGVGQATNLAAPVARMYTGAPATGTKFVGIAMDDVVNFDTAVTPRTSYPPTTRKVGEPFLVGESVEVWTNMITGTPALEGDAYLAADSTFGTTAVNGNGVVGKWKSTKDADGYALLQVKTL